METLAFRLWLGLVGVMALYTLSFWFIPRDFSGNDGGADDRKWPIVS